MGTRIGVKGSKESTAQIIGVGSKARLTSQYVPAETKQALGLIAMIGDHKRIAVIVNSLRSLPGTRLFVL